MNQYEANLNKENCGSAISNCFFLFLFLFWFVGGGEL